MECRVWSGWWVVEIVEWGCGVGSDECKVWRDECKVGSVECGLGSGE